jgi:hypothetical protein
MSSVKTTYQNNIKIVTTYKSDGKEWFTQHYDTAGRLIYSTREDDFIVFIQQEEQDKVKSKIQGEVQRI